MVSKGFRQATSFDYGASAPLGIAKRVQDKDNERVRPIDIEKLNKEPD
jgi:hypothetical protein